MKRTVLFISLCLLLAACGSDKTTSETGTSATSTESAEDTDTSEPENKGSVQHQMPDSDQIDEAYDAILEKADVDDPELMEVYISFSKSIASPESDRSHMSLHMVSPENKNKIVSYLYDFEKKQVEEAQEVTLSSGIGASEKFIDTYDGFKAALFKKSEIMDFDEVDEVYQAAIAKSGYEPKDCYVHQLQFKYAPTGELKGDVGVQSTRSTTAHKSFDIDKQGHLN